MEHPCEWTYLNHRNWQLYGTSIVLKNFLSFWNQNFLWNRNRVYNGFVSTLYTFSCCTRSRLSYQICTLLSFIKKLKSNQHLFFFYSCYLFSESRVISYFSFLKLCMLILISFFEKGEKKAAISVINLFTSLYDLILNILSCDLIFTYNQGHNSC